MWEIEKTITKYRKNWTKIDERMMKSVFEGSNIVKGRGGRFRQTWIAEVKTATEPRGITWEKAKTIAKYRKNCRKIDKELMRCF